MTLEEKIALLHGPMPLDARAPPAAIPAAGFVPGVPRLGIPNLYETDASLGVANPRDARPGDVATALPAGLALAASFDPQLAYRAGAVVGNEARAKGFNVLLGGGMDLTRDPRNGRNFEYLGEDPLLAGAMAGPAVRGIAGPARHLDAQALCAQCERDQSPLARRTYRPGGAARVGLAGVRDRHRTRSSGSGDVRL